MPFIVIYENNDMIWPMGEDPDVEGALQTIGEKDAVVAFQDMQDAKRSINISKKAALLQKVQGLPYNDDFVECIKHVKIRRLVFSGCPWKERKP